jgi:hypothetical protein
MGYAVKDFSRKKQARMARNNLGGCARATGSEDASFGKA